MRFIFMAECFYGGAVGGPDTRAEFWVTLPPIEARQRGHLWQMLGWGLHIVVDEVNFPS